MKREPYGCRSNENFKVKIASDSDESVFYLVEYTRYHLRRDDSIVWRWQCECKGYRIHRRICKHIRQAKKDYCGWREDKRYEPKAELEYLDEESGEAICPLCGDFAYPISQLKNLHDHISVYHTQTERGDSPE